MEQTPHGGPMVLGAKPGVAAGAWTDIVSISAPSQAAYGETVNIQVRVKNLADYAIYIAVTAQYDSVDVPISPEYANVAAGATYTFTGSFTMPNKSVRVWAWSFYWAGDEWWQDDSDYVDIALAEVYEGTISKKELEYNESRATIPASNIPQDKRGLVHIWGRNDMSSTQRMGIWWEVKDTDGVVRETYAAWETWPYTSPGSSHEFIGGRFDLDKAGTWRISVQLFMNPSDQEMVDSYSGTLCTVQAQVPEPEFAGFGISDYSKR